MAITVELAPEVEAALRADADQQGRDAADLVRAIVDEVYAAGNHLPTPEGGSLADLMEGYLGRVTGSGEAIAENGSHLFAEHVARKHGRGAR